MVVNQSCGIGYTIFDATLFSHRLNFVKCLLTFCEFFSAQLLNVGEIQLPKPSSLQTSGDCTVVRAAGAVSKTLSASSMVNACDGSSLGRPAALPTMENR